MPVWFSGTAATTPAVGNVAFLNTNTAVYSGTGSISSPMVVTNSGTNRVAFAVFAWDFSAGLSIGTPTYGGIAMSPCGPPATNTLSSYNYCQVFYLVNPPTGTNTLAAMVPSAEDVYANLIAFTGVNQTTPIRSGTYQNTSNVTSTGGTPNTSTLVVSSSTHDLTLTMIIDDVGVVSTSQTLDSQNTSGNMELLSDHATVAAATVVHTWTYGSSTVANSSLIGFSIQAA